MLLTGGSSRRMGRDKAAMEVAGMPLAARPVAALAALCDDVVLAGRRVDGVAGRVVADAEGFEGPLAGVLAGLRAARREVAVVAGCDMPAVEPAVAALLLDALLAAGDGATAAAACVRAGGWIEPLPMAVRCAAAGRLAAAMGRGAGSLREALEALSAAHVPESAWAAVDPRGATFESWNRPEDVRPL